MSNLVGLETLVYIVIEKGLLLITWQELMNKDKLTYVSLRSWENSQWTWLGTISLAKKFSNGFICWGIRVSWTVPMGRPGRSHGHKRPKAKTRREKEIADIFNYLVKFADMLDMDLETQALAQNRRKLCKVSVSKVKGKAVKYKDLWEFTLSRVEIRPLGNYVNTIENRVASQRIRTHSTNSGLFSSLANDEYAAGALLMERET